MPAASLDTQMIKAILEHRLVRGESLARCAQALGVSKGVVSKYVTLARAQGLEDWSLIESMSDSCLDSTFKCNTPSPYEVLPWNRPEPIPT